MTSDKDQIKAKLKKLKKFAGLDRKQVADLVDLSPAYLNQMLGKDGKLPPRFIRMFNDLCNIYLNILPSETTQPKLIGLTTPKPLEITNKKLKVEMQDNTLYIKRKDDSGFTDYAHRMTAATHFHEVEGDAMHPSIQRGAGLLITEIDKNLIIGGEAYVIELLNGMTVVRYIKFDEKEPQKLILTSYNKSAGETFNIEKADLKRLFKILLKISK
jgi:transcriptional regulator with XRE-family HTH domain